MADLNLAEVIEKILASLPPSHKSDSALKGLSMCLPYTSVEQMHYRWDQLREIVRINFPDEKTPLAVKVRGIIQREETEDA